MRRRMMKIAIMVCLLAAFAADPVAEAEADAYQYYQGYNNWNQGMNNWNQRMNNWNQGMNNWNQGMNNLNQGQGRNFHRNINNMNFENTMAKLNGFNNMYNNRNY